MELRIARRPAQLGELAQSKAELEPPAASGAL
jgi:hypothetical protein